MKIQLSTKKDKSLLIEISPQDAEKIFGGGDTKRYVKVVDWDLAREVRIVPQQFVVHPDSVTYPHIPE